MKRRTKFILLAAAILPVPLLLYGLDDSYLDVYWYGNIGVNTSGGNKSLTVGTNNISSGSQSAAIGYGLQNYQPDNLTVGQYNSPPAAGELFTVGNGHYYTSSATRKNALSVSTDGVKISGTAEITAIQRKGGIENFTGTPPAWWSHAQHGFTNSSPGSSDSPANIGQLKHTAKQAKLYLDFHLAAGGGAGPQINDMCSFANNENAAPVAVGQLKNVAEAFYDRLNQVGYNWQSKAYGTASTPYAWNGTTSAENAAPATTGQIKQVFSFDLGYAFYSHDGDGDSIPSWWEKAYGLNADVANGNEDPDFDQLSNYEEFYLASVRVGTFDPLDSKSSSSAWTDYERSLITGVEGGMEADVEALRGTDLHALRESLNLVSYSRGVKNWESGRMLQLGSAFPPWESSALPSFNAIIWKSDIQDYLPGHASIAIPSGLTSFSNMQDPLIPWPLIARSISSMAPYTLGNNRLAKSAGGVWDQIILEANTNMLHSHSRHMQGMYNECKYWLQNPFMFGTDFTVSRKVYTLRSIRPNPLYPFTPTVAQPLPPADKLESVFLSISPSKQFSEQDLTMIPPLPTADLTHGQGYTSRAQAFLFRFFAYPPGKIGGMGGGRPVMPDDDSPGYVEAHPNENYEQGGTMPDIDKNRADIATHGKLWDGVGYDKDFNRLYIEADGFPEDEAKVEIEVQKDSGTSIFFYRQFPSGTQTIWQAVPESAFVSTPGAPICPAFSYMRDNSVGLYAEIGRLGTAVNTTLPPCGKVTLILKATFPHPGPDRALDKKLIRTIVLTQVSLKWKEVYQFDNLAENKSPVPFDWNLDPKGQSSWLPGGGKQLIVDSKAPGGVLRNKVKIQFYPPNLETSGSTVYLKIFDVDDPVPIDFDTRGSPNPIIDTNGEAGGDNFGSEALRTGRFKFPEQQGVSNRQIQFDSSGNQISASCEISASLGTLIDVLFETTAQPGDNFRAVLSLSAGELATVQTENPLADGYLNSGYEGIRKLVPYTNLFSSEMLTIWRQLSVEIDSMPTPPALLSAPDNIPFQAGFAVWQGSGNPDKVRCPMNLLSYESDFYVNGVLELQNGDKFKIIGSESNHWNTTTMLKLDRALTPLEGSLISSSAGTLKDDDGIRWPVNDLGPMLPRFDLISDPSTQNLIVARFIPAYILVKPIVWLNTNPTVQWEQYHGPESDNNKFVASRDINGSQNFWCAHLSAGYQTTSPGKSIFEDAEDSLLGATWAANKACVVFPENIREYGFIESYLHSPDPWIFAKGVKELRIGLAGVAAHELGHLPGQHSGNTNPEADHNEGGLQGDGVFNIRIETFRAKSIRRFRRVDDWTGGPPS